MSSEWIFFTTSSQALKVFCLKILIEGYHIEFSWFKPHCQRWFLDSNKNVFFPKAPDKCAVVFWMVITRSKSLIKADKSSKLL